jgi:hypothetical protein
VRTTSAASIAPPATSSMAITPTAIGSGIITAQVASTSELALDSS